MTSLIGESANFSFTLVNTVTLFFFYKTGISVVWSSDHVSVMEQSNVCARVDFRRMT